MQNSDGHHCVLSSRLENPKWFTTDSLSCITCEHREEEAIIVEGPVQVNIDVSNMDNSNNAKEDNVEAPGQAHLFSIRHHKATWMISFFEL